MVVEHVQAFVEFFDALSQPDALPAVFHCSAGRDRTGVAAALLLNVLGVPDEAIAADYARTGALLMPHLHRYARMRDSLGLTDDQMAALLMTEARVMARFMSWLRDEYGNAADMLLGAGLPAATLAGLKGRLLQGD
jgi:protein-tyrosine phosphatase